MVAVNVQLLMNSTSMVIVTAGMQVASFTPLPKLFDPKNVVKIPLDELS